MVGIDGEYRHPGFFEFRAQVEQLVEDERVVHRLDVILRGLVADLHDRGMQQLGDDRERHARDEHAFARGEVRAAREQPLDFTVANRFGLLRQRADDGHRDARLVPGMEAFGVLGDDLLDERDRFAAVIEVIVDDMLERVDVDQMNAGDPTPPRGRRRAAPRCR